MKGNISMGNLRCCKTKDWMTCRYISFTTLKEQIKAVGHILKFIKPEFLEEISESCELEEL
jgi:hypothetical protein